jgi:hypothetical protein
MKVGLFCLLLTRITLGLKYLQTFKIRRTYVQLRPLKSQTGKIQTPCINSEI